MSATKRLDPVQRAWVHAHRNVTREVDAPLEILMGAIPDALRGVFFHNGPGRLRRRRVQYGHLFDGDGMLLRFEFGARGIRYRNRFVRTREYLRESLADLVLYRGFGTLIPGGFFANALRMRFKNAANTNVVAHAGKLFALWEGGLPHVVDPETLDVVDRHDFGGRLLDNTIPNRLINEERPFSAHPKLDHATGELFSFGIVMGQKQKVLIYRVTPDGVMDEPRAIELDASTYVHDFTVTDRYIVLFLCPLESDSARIVLGLSAPVNAMTFNAERPVKILLVPRDGGSPREATVPACFVLHFANAFDTEHGNVVVDGLRLPGFPKIPDLLTGAFDPNDNPEAFLTRFEIDHETLAVTERSLCIHPIELPTVHPRLRGRPHRYVYGICIERPGADPIYTGLVKVDTATGETIYREPLFVPAPGGTEEDDGWIVTLLYVDAEDRSQLHVLDARTMEPVCIAALPHHVPPGFHGTFLPR